VTNSAIGGRAWIDVSVPVHGDMVHWPGNTPVVVEPVLDLGKGDLYSLSRVSMSWHTGTHIDAPCHYVQGGATVDQFPVTAGVVSALVVPIRHPEAVRIEELRRQPIRKGSRVLFRTRNSTRAWRRDRFVEDYVYVTREAASWLVKRGVALVGVDYLSVGAFLHDGNETHQILLGAGVWVLEGLDLSKVSPGHHDMIVMPIRVRRGDGAPARVVLRSKIRRN
jgi:arylformamidase